MRKILAALLLTCALALSARAGETPNNTPANTDGIIECPYHGHMETTFADGQMETPLAVEMGFPLLLMLLL